MRSLFREYQFATIQVRGQELDEVIEMFIRINTEGMQLELIDLMAARTLAPGFNLRNAIDKFRNEIKNKHYDKISDHTVLQTLSLLHMQSCKAKEILQIPKDKFISLWGPTKKALKCAIDFVTSAIECPDYNLLPYDAILAPFAYFFYKTNSNQPNQEQKRNLIRLFWHASLSNRFSSAAETKLHDDTIIIQNILANKPVKLQYVENITAERVKE